MTLPGIYTESVIHRFFAPFLWARLTPPLPIGQAKKNPNISRDFSEFRHSPHDLAICCDPDFLSEDLYFLIRRLSGPERSLVDIVNQTCSLKSRKVRRLSELESSCGILLMFASLPIRSGRI